MPIPKTFQLGGRTWTVKRRVRSKKWYGRTHQSECRIELSTYNKNEEEELHTFMHELLHAVAGTMGWEKLNNDEVKIDALAGLLVQAMQTSES